MIMVEYMILCAAGFVISLYTYLLEQKIKRVPSYKPFCDISDAVSCTKPMKSSYASLFFISNALVALIFYAIMFVFAYWGMIIPLIIGSFVSFIASVFYAYLLFFKIKSACLLCIALYCINLMLFLLSSFYLVVVSH